MHLERNPHPAELWYNPSFPDIAKQVQQSGIEKQRKAYNKLRLRREKMARFGPFWPLLQPYVIAAILLLVMPGIWISANGNKQIGAGFVLLSIALIIGIETGYTLRGQRLERRLRESVATIRKQHKVGTLTSDELAWRMFDDALRECNLNLLMLLESPLLFEATAGEIQGFLDETHELFVDLTTSRSKLAPVMIEYMEELAKTKATAYAASIGIKVARIRLWRAENE